MNIILKIINTVRGCGALLAVAAWLLLAPVPPARAQTPEAKALRAKVSLAVIQKYAPDVTFHYWEKYFPAAAEDLFRGAQKFSVEKDTENRNSPFVPLGSVNDLATLSAQWRIKLDPQNPKVLAGDVSGTHPTQQVKAPMYVSVGVPADATFVRLTYRFLFGYNGAQTIRCVDAIGHFNFIMGTLAEHEGDWEGMEVLLAPDLGSVLAVTFEAHGNKTRYRPAEVDWTEGTHPQARLALNSHGVYNGKGKNDNDWITLDGVGAMEFVDIITKQGASWRPWTLPNGLRVFGRSASGPVGTETWAGFAGRMGTYKVNSASWVADVSGSSLNSNESFRATANRLVVAGYTFFKSEHCSGVPPVGPGGRSEYRVDLPEFPTLSGQKEYTIYSGVAPGMVLAANKSNPAAGLIIDVLRPGDRSQHWYVVDNPDHSVSLINVESRTLAFVPNGNGNPVTLVPRALQDEYSTWIVSGNRAQACSLSPVHDAGQALDVFKAKTNPGAIVGTWSKSPGAPNENWKLLEAATEAPAFIIHSKAGVNLVLTAPGGDPKDGLILDTYRPGDLTQRWSVLNQGNNTFVLKNQAQGRIAYVPNGNGNRVTLVAATAITPFSTWTIDRDWASGCVLKPLHDPGQCLDAFGNGPYQARNPVGTWGWGGGQANELWIIKAP